MSAAGVPGIIARSRIRRYGNWFRTDKGNNMKMRLCGLAAAALLAVSGSAFAIGTTMVGPSKGMPHANLSNLGEEPPASVLVSAGGLDWAWANPCSGTPSECGGGQSGVMLFGGWRYATDAEWLASFTDAADLVAKFTLPSGGVKCASPYFSFNFDHCDMGDALSGYIWHSPLAGPGLGDNAYSETFLVREVPEPETYALMLAGLGLVGFMARRRKLQG